MKLVQPKKIVAFIAILLLIALKAHPQTVTPWITTGDRSKLLQAQATVSFGPNIIQSNAVITLDPSSTLQTMDGFGYCMTEGSAEVITTLNSYSQSLLLNELFNKSTGLGISALRISIGASDLSSSDYSYDEVSGDVNMANFSLAGPDLTYLIPILKKVLIINPDIKILATPWSAPQWMKSNTSWKGGNLNGTAYQAYANYFVHYIKAMKDQGINIWAITPQNEPEYGGNDPSMTMTASEETNFINNNLGPALANGGFSTVKIIAYDHNCDDTTYPIFVCNNSTYVDGAAFHLYGGNISALTTVKNATNKNVYFTEQYTNTNDNFSSDFGWHLQNIIIGAANNWAKAILEWNIASNAALGPHTPGGCSTCLGAVTINSSSTYSRNLSYYIIGQISKFVLSGAVRIKSTSTSSSLLATAYKNPDGSFAVVTYNSNSSSQLIKIVWNSQTFVYTVPASSAATFVWNPAASGISDIPGDQIRLSPNPGHSYVKLVLPKNGFTVKSVSFITLDGKVALNQSVSTVTSDNNINVSTLPNGIYIIRLEGLNEHLYGRFIKQ